MKHWLGSYLCTGAVAFLLPSAGEGAGRHWWAGNHSVGLRGSNNHLNNHQQLHNLRQQNYSGNSETSSPTPIPAFLGVSSLAESSEAGTQTAAGPLESLWIRTGFSILYTHLT